MMISVIVPVYKVEKYLHQCLESIINQTYRDLEIIPVDDGSPDNCGKIIDEFAALDSRIRPIHQVNGGYGKAVNAGFDAATGMYVAIVESDDWIEPDMFKRLTDAAAYPKKTPEIIKSGFNRIIDGKTAGTVTLEKVIERHGNFIAPCAGDCASLYLFESSIWSSIYRRDFLLKYKLRMIETRGAAYQDSIFKFMAYARCQCMYLLPGAVYNYRATVQGSSSLSNQRPLAMFDNYRLLEEYFASEHLSGKMAEMVAFHKMFDFVFHYNRLSGEPRKMFLDCAAEEMRRIRKSGIVPEQLNCDDHTRDYLKSAVLPLVNRIENRRNGRLWWIRTTEKWKRSVTLQSIQTLLSGVGYCIGGLFSLLLWIPRWMLSNLFVWVSRKALQQQDARLKQEQLERFYSVHRLIENCNDIYLKEFRSLKKDSSDLETRMNEQFLLIQQELQGIVVTQQKLLAMIQKAIQVEPTEGVLPYGSKNEKD